MNFKGFQSRLLFSILIGGGFFLQGCESDDDKKEPLTNYEEGVIFVNEGKFLAGTGTVDFYNPTTNQVTSNIFQNEEGFAGDVLQSITFTEDRAFLVLNGDNKIEVVDDKDFTGKSTFTAPILVAPRYMQVVGDKAFVSVWGPYDENWSLTNSFVLVLNASTMTPLDTIYTDEGTENLLYNGEYIFASNFNYGSSSTLAIINPTDNTLVDEIELAEGPSGSVLDKNNKLWVITTGKGDITGKLFRINPSTFAIEEEIDLGVKPGGDLVISPAKDQLFYHVGKNIYKISIDATDAPEAAFFEAEDVVTAYSLGADPSNGDLYIGDAVDYASPGKVYIYTSDGTFKTSLGSGICPTQFIFRK